MEYLHKSEVSELLNAKLIQSMNAERERMSETSARIQDLETVIKAIALQNGGSIAVSDVHMEMSRVAELSSWRDEKHRGFIITAKW
jgi:hypothetical protein